MRKQLSETIGKEFKNQSGIYIIYIAAHIYIGSTKCFYTRLQTHRKQLRAGKHENVKFINAYKKYGEKECYWDILEHCSINNLKSREKWWIEHLHSDLNINKDPTIIPTNIIYNCKKSSKHVYQYDLDGNFLQEYTSVQEAKRQNPEIDARGIALVASKRKSYCKTAGGYQWSYTKVDKMMPYINNSDKAKIITVYIFDVLTGKETKYNSIAEAARKLFPQQSNFDSICAAISGATKHSQYINCRYLARNEDSNYQVPKRNQAIVDTLNNRIFKDAKVASAELNKSAYRLKKRCEDPLDTSLYYLNHCARIKLRESGKLLEEDNPNPSLIEI
jgi:group I intron endonuclease